MSTELVTSKNGSIAEYETYDLMPVYDMTSIVKRRDTMLGFVRECMVPDVHYGKIPGTGKDTLFKAGAEQLCTLFGLSVRFQTVEVVQDWSGKDHGGEPFFYYWYRCILSKGNRDVCEAEGSCNSWEKKYRYRDAQRVCPSCGKNTIRFNKDRRNFYCWTKIEGCGEQFGGNDEAIINQPVGKVPNAEVHDLVNTVQKMAQKRALVAAVLIGVNASAYFSQDLEDRLADFDPAQIDPRSGNVVKVEEVNTAKDEAEILRREIAEDFVADFAKLPASMQGAVKAWTSSRKWPQNFLDFSSQQLAAVRNYTAYLVRESKLAKSEQQKAGQAKPKADARTASTPPIQAAVAQPAVANEAPAAQINEAEKYIDTDPSLEKSFLSMELDDPFLEGN